MRATNTRGMSVRKLLAAAVIAALGAGGAHAVEDYEVKLEGTAPEVCSLPALSPTTPPLAELISAGATVNTTQHEVLRLDTAMCNYAVDVGLRSTHGGMVNDDRNQASLPDGVTNKIEYVATVNWGNTVLTLDAAERVKNDNLGPANSALVIRVTPTADTTNVLLAGEYEDTLTLRIGGEL